MPEKNIFVGFYLPFMGGHLGYVTSLILTFFYFLVPESLHTKFSSKQPSGFWENPVLIFICKCPWVKVKK